MIPSERAPLLFIYSSTKINCSTSICLMVNIANLSIIYFSPNQVDASTNTYVYINICNYTTNTYVYINIYNYTYLDLYIHRPHKQFNSLREGKCPFLIMSAKKDHKKKLHFYQTSLESAIQRKDEQSLFEWISSVVDEDFPVSYIRQLISPFLQSKLWQFPIFLPSRFCIVSKQLPLESQKNLLSFLLEKAEARSLNSEEQVSVSLLFPMQHTHSDVEHYCEGIFV